MTHAEVDLDVCQAYGICAQVAPDVFDLDDDGYATVTREGAVDDASRAVVEEAAEACPVRAIKLV